MALHEQQRGQDGSAHRRDPSRSMVHRRISLVIETRSNSGFFFPPPKFCFFSRFILSRRIGGVDHAAALAPASPSIYVGYVF